MISKPLFLINNFNDESSQERDLKFMYDNQYFYFDLNAKDL